jgi:hypothetical protein
VRAFDELTVYGIASLAAKGIGGTLPPCPVENEIAPRADATEWRTRFADAVPRARRWKD